MGRQHLLDRKLNALLERLDIPKIDTSFLRRLLGGRGPSNKRREAKSVRPLWGCTVSAIRLRRQWILLVSRSRSASGALSHSDGNVGQSCRRAGCHAGYSVKCIQVEERCRLYALRCIRKGSRGSRSHPLHGPTKKPESRIPALWITKNAAGIGCPALSSLSIPAISHFRKSSRQDPTVTAQREWFP